MLNILYTSDLLQILPMMADTIFNIYLPKYELFEIANVITYCNTERIYYFNP